MNDASDPESKSAQAEVCQPESEISLTQAVASSTVPWTEYIMLTTLSAGGFPPPATDVWLPVSSDSWTRPSRHREAYYASLGSIGTISELLRDDQR